MSLRIHVQHHRHMPDTHIPPHTATYHHHHIPTSNVSCRTRNTPGVLTRRKKGAKCDRETNAATCLQGAGTGNEPQWNTSHTYITTYSLSLSLSLSFPLYLSPPPHPPLSVCQSLPLYMYKPNHTYTLPGRRAVVQRRCDVHTLAAQRAVVRAVGLDDPALAAHWRLATTRSGQHREPCATHHTGVSRY